MQQRGIPFVARLWGHIENFFRHKFIPVLHDAFIVRLNVRVRNQAMVATGVIDSVNPSGIARSSVFLDGRVAERCGDLT